MQAYTFNDVEISASMSMNEWSHNASFLLINNSWISLISLDFSKAFEYVRHLYLFHSFFLSFSLKLIDNSLPLVDLTPFINWLIWFAFLHNRSYFTRPFGIKHTSKLTLDLDPPLMASSNTPMTLTCSYRSARLFSLSMPTYLHRL